MNDIAHFNEILDNILIPRVVGTENHKKVREYIVKELKDLKWTTELDEFDDKTPNMGTLTFTNIIAKLNPNAERYLVLACHYDSKYFHDVEFLGKSCCNFEFDLIFEPKIVNSSFNQKVQQIQQFLVQC